MKKFRLISSADRVLGEAILSERSANQINKALYHMGSWTKFYEVIKEYDDGEAIVFTKIE